jgi:transcriptional regulator with XRE-family HTH domain
MKKDLKTRLKEAMNERKIKTPALASRLGIPKDRIYAWYRDGSNPKGEDARKIEAWIAGSEIEESSNLASISEPSLGSITRLLQRILDEQTLTRADVRAFGEYQVMKDSAGNEQVREEIMAQINRLVAVNLGELTKTGIRADGGT